MEVDDELSLEDEILYLKQKIRQLETKLRYKGNIPLSISDHSNKLEKAVDTFYKEYFDEYWINAIGRTKNNIIVYLKRKIPKNLNTFPSEWEGFPVEIKFSGPMNPM